MNYLKRIIVIFVAFSLFSSCGNRERDLQKVTFRGTVFGTYYAVSYFAPDGRNYQAALDSLFQEINSSLSYYDPQSVISKVNRNETDMADGYFLSVLQRSLEIAKETDGAFDPTISPLVNAWGFGFAEQQNITQPLIDSLMLVVGFQNVAIEGNRVVKEIPQIQFDFNAIAKGYAADMAGQMLEARGINSYLVELGGDLVARGTKPDGSPWRIGIEKPAEHMLSPQEWAYMVEISGKGLATSGSTRKYYEKNGQRFSHTIDPATGRPVEHNLLSVSVIANDCMTADAFATAFMVMGLEKSIEFVEAREDLEAFFIFSQGIDELGSYATKDFEVISRSEFEQQSL